MRSELAEAQLIDSYLFRQLSETDEGIFRARLLLSEELAEKVETQRQAHRLIRRYARERERDRLERIHRQLLDEPVFAHRLKTIFAI